MSIFASLHTLVVHPPADPEASITIQRLTGKSVEMAQAEHMRQTQAGFTGRGWASMFLRRILAGIGTEEDLDKITTDPLVGFDRLSVVKLGVKAWSFEVDGKPKPVNADAIADIDDETLEYLAVEIMRLTRPALFQTVEQLEAARKNASRPSTVA